MFHVKRCARCGGDLELPGRDMDPPVTWLEPVRARGFGGKGKLAHPDCEAAAKALQLKGYRPRGRRPGDPRWAAADSPAVRAAAKATRLARGTLGRPGICQVCRLPLLPEERTRIIGASNSGEFAHASCAAEDAVITRAVRHHDVGGGFEEGSSIGAAHCWVPLEALDPLWPDLDGEVHWSERELKAIACADAAIVLGRPHRRGSRAFGDRWPRHRYRRAG